MENLQTQPSYADTLRETLQEEFPLLSDVTQGIVDDPLSLMNAHADDDGVVVPCALPDAMWKNLPQMMSETLSLYDDADIRTMLLMAMTHPGLGDEQCTRATWSATLLARHDEHLRGTLGLGQGLRGRCSQSCR